MKTLEVWKDIPGYVGKYQASNLGRIKSLKRQVHGVNHYTGKPFLRTVPERILRPGKYCKSGHLSVILGKGTNGRPVHQLVMLAFKGEVPEGMEVLHINGNPGDNRVNNLRYGSRSDNIFDVYKIGKAWRKLNTDDVKEIRKRLSSGETGRSIAPDYNVCESSISKIKTGRCFWWLE